MWVTFSLVGLCTCTCILNSYFVLVNVHHLAMFENWRNDHNMALYRTLPFKNNTLLTGEKVKSTQWVFKQNGPGFVVA